MDVFTLSRRAARASACALLLVALATVAHGTDSYDVNTRELSVPSVVIGSVVGAPAGTAPLGSADLYDPATGLLTVPAVVVGSKTYYNAVASVSALDAVVTVAGIVKVKGGMPASPWDSYDIPSGQLTIPVVAAGGAIHTNVVVAVGRILSVGGGGPPAPYQFSPLASSLTTPRGNHAAAALADGRVLLTDGTSASGKGVAALNTAEVYDPTANTFTPVVATMTVPRAGHTATPLPDGQVLITGGISNAGAILNSAETYNPRTRTFAALPSVLIDGGVENSAFSVANGAELYDPVAESFTALSATLVTARGAHSATLLPSGSVLHVGGYTAKSAAALSSAELYSY